MIEKMKKMALLVYHNSKDKFLTNLQSLGAVHLEVNSAAQNEEISLLKEKLTDLSKALNLLKKKSIEYKFKESLKQEKLKISFEELLEKINEEDDNLEELESQKEILEKEYGILYPWGKFDPENIERLNEIGINLKYYKIQSAKLNKINTSDFAMEKISTIKNYTYFVIFYKEGKELPLVDALEIKIPLKNIEKLEKEIDKLEKEIDKQKITLFNYLKYNNEIQNEILKNENKLSYMITDASLLPEVEGKILIITGWVPKKQQAVLEEFLIKEDVYYLIEEPKEDDNVPVLLKNLPILNLFEPITKMHSLPQYNEVDPTPFFAPFFAAFFGLCLGDLGYGLIILSAVIFALIFLGRNKNLRKTLILGVVLSIFTITCGVILNSFFGAEIAKLDFMPERIKKLIIFKEIGDAMLFAIFIGVIQVIIGMILRIINRVRLKGIKGAFYPLGTILMLIAGIFTIILKKGPNVKFLGIVLSEQILKIPIIFGLDPYSKILVFTTIDWMCILIGGIGILFVLLFNNVDKKIFIRPLTGLWEIYGIVTGVPGDILSYIRLFALGLASGLLGNAFNQIGFMIRDGASASGNIIFIILGYLSMSLILLLGHGINLGLAALSAFVHPLRLILLEFYKSVDFTGGGKEYSPFKNKLLIKNK